VKHTEKAILTALRDEGTKTAALLRAWRDLNESGHYIGQHELAWQWDSLVHRQAIVRDGRRWRAASWA